MMQPPGEIIGRVTNGDVGLDGAQVTLHGGLDQIAVLGLEAALAQALCPVLAEAETGPRPPPAPEGGGWFALAPNAAPGETAMLAVALGGGIIASTVCVIPAAGRRLQLAFTLPAIGRAGAPGSAPDRDAMSCGSCALGAKVAPRPAPAPEGWRSFATPRVRVDYTFEGPDGLPEEHCPPPAAPTPLALPHGPDGLLLADVAPSYVQEVALIAERALDHFTASLGLRDPGPQCIRIGSLEYPGIGVVYGETRPEWDHLRIHHNNATERNFGTVPHEIFHRIQYAYNPSVDQEQELHSAIREGGAVLAEEAFTPEANRYVHRARAYVAQPWRPMAERASEGPRQSYAAALFWRYLEERLGPAGGEMRMAAMRRILEATATRWPDGSARAGGYSVAVIRRALAGSLRFDRFARLGDDQADRATTDTLYGNWLIANALMRDAAEIADPRFRYAEAMQVAPPLIGSGQQVIFPATRLCDLERPILVGDAPRLRPGTLLQFPPGGPATSWTARYFRLAGEGLLRIRVMSEAEDSDPLVQLLRLDAEGRLFVLRDDGPSVTMHLAVAQTDRVFLIVATREKEVPYTVTAELLPDAPLPFITPWNCVAGNTHETDPDVAPWDWLSPDITLLEPRAMLDPEVPVRLRVRVTNRGTAPTPGVTIRLDAGLAENYAVLCRLAPALGPDGSASGAMTGALAPGASAEVELAWVPPLAAPAHAWVLRATAEAIGAPAPATALGRPAAITNVAHWTHPEPGEFP